MTITTMATYIATIGSVECDITAEWQFAAKGRQHAFTWRVLRYSVNGTDSYALASDTFKVGDYNAFLSGLSETRALQVAERSARRQQATRIR